MFKRTSIKPYLISAAVAACVMSPAAGVARADQPGTNEVVELDIDAPSLGDALRQLGAQASLSLLYSDALVAGRPATPLHGSYRPDDALTKLLQGTGLEAVSGKGNAYVIRKQADKTGAPARAASPSRAAAHHCPASARRGRG